MPPEVESIGGVKTPCLILSTCWPYVLFICMLLVCDRKTYGTVAGSFGVKYPYIKIDILEVFQNPLVRTSSCAPLSVLADTSLRVSPDSGCRCGSIATLGQASVSRDAVKSLISIMANRGETPHVANQCMIESEALLQLQSQGVLERDNS